MNERPTSRDTGHKPSPINVNAGNDALMAMPAIGIANAAMPMPGRNGNANMLSLYPIAIWHVLAFALVVIHLFTWRTMVTLRHYYNLIMNIVIVRCR